LDLFFIYKILKQGVVKKCIILPDTAKEKPQVGEIVAVGPGKVSDVGNTIAMTLKVGDNVLYGKYSGTEITVVGDDVLIMRESDILAVL
jgi:chaperonin GroES